MLVIKRNSLNQLVVSVSSHKTLANPNYLFSFEHILSKEKVRFFPTNISTSTNRYDEFEFYEGQQPLNTGQFENVPFVLFPYPGQYYYSVYEMFNTGTTNPQYAFDKLEEGRAYVEDTSIENPYTYTYTSSNEQNSNYIYYKPGTNNPEVLFKMEQLDGFNAYGNYWNWNYLYPDSVIEDLTTGETLRIENNLYDIDDCNQGYTRFSGESQYKKIVTGTTSNSTRLKIYTDPNQITAYGYGYGDLSNLPPYITGYTYSNFRTITPGPIGWFRADQNALYDDGTTGNTTNKVITTNRFILPSIPISGNTTSYFQSPSSVYTGYTYDSAGQQTSSLKTIYFNGQENNWTIDPYSGQTLQYSLTKCVQTPSSQTIYFSRNVGGINYIGSGDTSGNFNFIGVYVPVTPTPTPTSTITPTPTLTPTNTPTPTMTPTPSPGPAFDADAAAYLSAVISAGGSLDATISGATNTLFTSLKSAGLYSKLDTLYMMIGGTSGSTALNGIRTNSQFDITWTNPGSMTFDYSGATGNGSTTYGNTNYNPRNESSATDTSWGIYHTAGNFGANNGETYSFGAFDGTYINNHSHPPGNLRIYGYNVGSNYNIGNPTDYNGSYISTITSGTKALYHNLGSGSSLSGSSAPGGSAFLVNQPYYLFTLNLNGSPYSGNYFNGRIQHFFNGDYLTPSETTTMMGILNTFETTLGRNLY